MAVRLGIDAVIGARRGAGGMCRLRRRGVPSDKGGFYTADFFTHNQKAEYNIDILYSPAHSTRVVHVWFQCHISFKLWNLPEVEDNQGVDWNDAPVRLGEKFLGLDDVDKTAPGPIFTNWHVLSLKRHRPAFLPGRGGNLFFTRERSSSA